MHIFQTSKLNEENVEGRLCFQHMLVFQFIFLLVSVGPSDDEIDIADVTGNKKSIKAYLQQAFEGSTANLDPLFSAYDQLISRY